MNKKLMLLAAGALSALAFAALPAVASAGEFTADCSSGATCAGTIAGGHAVLENDGGGALGEITCTGNSGVTSQTSASATGTVELSFTGCKELVFGTQCSNTATSGKITTNTMVSHLVYLEADKSKIGVLLTGTNVTFSCPVVGVVKTVTGNIIGEIEEKSCNTNLASFKVNFEAGTTTGTQKWKQVTTAGTVFDLTSGTQASDATTSSQTGTGTVTVGESKTIKFTC